MDLLNGLFNKVKREIEDRTINTMDYEFSVYRHKVVLIINDKRFDISARIPNEIWDIGGVYKSPEDKWKITCEVNRQAIKFICEFDPSFDANKFPGFEG